MTVLETPLVRKLSAFVAMSDKELSTLSDMQGRSRVLRAGSSVMHEGQTDQPAYVLTSGWVCSYKTLPEGTRQIVDFQVPGDFLGLRSLLFRTSDHNIDPVTQIEVTELRIGDLLEGFDKSPRLAVAVLWAMSRDEAMVVEHLVNIGRRNAKERTVHFLLELKARLALVGLVTSTGFACPLSQYMLADALGLSAVHINRVLRELRDAGLLTFQKGMVQIHDLNGLVELADFDTAYLDHDGPLLK